MGALCARYAEERHAVQDLPHLAAEPRAAVTAWQRVGARPGVAGWSGWQEAGAGQPSEVWCGGKEPQWGLIGFSFCSTESCWHAWRGELVRE